MSLFRKIYKQKQQIYLNYENVKLNLQPSIQKTGCFFLRFVDSLKCHCLMYSFWNENIFWKKQTQQTETYFGLRIERPSLDDWFHLLAKKRQMLLWVFSETDSQRLFVGVSFSEGEALKIKIVVKNKHIISVLIFSSITGHGQSWACRSGESGPHMNTVAIFGSLLSNWPSSLYFLIPEGCEWKSKECYMKYFTLSHTPTGCKSLPPTEG